MSPADELFLEAKCVSSHLWSREPRGTKHGNRARERAPRQKLCPRVEGGAPLLPPAAASGPRVAAPSRQPPPFPDPCDRAFRFLTAKA